MSKTLQQQLELYREALLQCAHYIEDGGGADDFAACREAWRAAFASDQPEPPSATDVADRNAYQYMMLARYKMDLDYYWGHGNQNPKHLYFGDYSKHLQETVNLWQRMPVTPRWFTAEQLTGYTYLINNIDRHDRYTQEDYCSYCHKQDDCQICGYSPEYPAGV